MMPAGGRGDADEIINVADAVQLPDHGNESPASGPYGKSLRARHGGKPVSHTARESAINKSSPSRAAKAKLGHPQKISNATQPAAASAQQHRSGIDVEMEEI